MAAFVVHVAPETEWRSEGMPCLRRAAAKRSSDLCTANNPGDVRQLWAHLRSSWHRCAPRADRTAAANSWLAVAVLLRAEASYGMQSVPYTRHITTSALALQSQHRNANLAPAR